MKRIHAAVLVTALAASAHAAPPLVPLTPEQDRHEAPLTGTTDMGSVRALKAFLERHEPEAHEAGEEGIDLLHALLSWIEPRAYPGDRVDWKRIAEQSRKRLPPPSEKMPPFQFVGPQNVPVPYRIYFGEGPLNGRANAVAFDPVEPRTYYVGSAGGGVWKTTDAGGTWAPLTDRWPILRVSALVALPQQPGETATTLIAGTGDFPYPAMAPAMGLMRSRDGGTTWQHIGPDELSNFAISKILVDPDDPRILTVACGRGMRVYGRVWRSVDGGGSWNPVLGEMVWCGLSAGAPDAAGRRWYWAVGYDGAGWRQVYRSGDRGATWEPVHRAGPHNFFDLAQVAASPVDPDVAYVLLGGLNKILETRDAGKSFQDITGNFPGGYNWSQDWYDCWMTVSSATIGRKVVDVLYVGLIDVVQRVDRNGWRSIGRTYTPAALAHNDQQGVAVDPLDPNHLLTASDGGVYELTFNPTRDTWAFRSLNARLGITQFYRSAYHPTAPDVMLAGTQDNSTPCCQGDPATWINVGGGDGAFCGINGKNPDIQYASSQFLNIYRTADSWRHAQRIGVDAGNDRRAFIAPFVLDPVDPTVLYAGTDHLWRWDDGPRRWTPRLGGQRLSRNGVVNAIAVSSFNPRRLYTGSSQGEVWTSGDGGGHWTRIDDIGAPLPPRTVTSISIAPGNTVDLIVTLSGTGAPHVWRCADANHVEWKDVSGEDERFRLPDVPANCLARDPADPAHRWFLATDAGLFFTNNAGRQWVDATEAMGLPGVHINELVAVPGTGYLNAVTFGRGLWRTRLSRGDASSSTSSTAEPRTTGR